MAFKAKVMAVSGLAICMRDTSEMRTIWVTEVHNWIFRTRIITERKWHIQTKAAGANEVRHINLIRDYDSKQLW